jgi:hypothetical protein
MKKWILKQIQMKFSRLLGNIVKIYSKKTGKSRRNGSISRHIWATKSESGGHKQPK